MKKTLLTAMILFLGLSAYSQQSSFSDYYGNPVFYNPAFTGNKDALFVAAQYHLQWRDIENAPSTALISAHSPIGLSASSVGISVYNDQFGYAGTTGAVISYAYRWQTKVGRISTALQTALENYQHNLTQAHAGTSGDPVLAADINLFHANAGVGIAWENEKGYFGFSIPKLMKEDLSETDQTAAGKSASQFNLSGTYTFEINDRWKWAPALLYTYIESLPSQMDVQLHFIFDDALELHAGFRSNSMYTGGVRYNIWKDLQLGYSYDYYACTLGNAAGGGHEITLSYDLVNKEGE